MTRSSTAVACVWLVLVLGSTPAGADDLRQALEAANGSLIAALLRGDAAAVADHYTDDAQVIAPGAPVASGRAAITAFWEGAIAAGISDVTLETADAGSEGSLAYETGALGLVSKDGARTAARYTVVWKRVGDRWLLHRDTWNVGGE